MSRRIRILLACLAASLAGLGAWIATNGVPPQYYALQRRWQPAWVPWDARIEDSAGALAIGKRSVAEQIERYERELGIDLRVVVLRSFPKNAPAGEAFAEQVLDDREIGGGFTTGGLVVVIAVAERRIAAAATDDLAGPVGERFGPLVEARAVPWLGHRYAGIALASGLGRLAEELLERAREGTLEVAQPGSVLELVRADERNAAPCRGEPAPAADPADSVEALRCLLRAGRLTGDSALLTEASRVHLARAPLGAFASRARAAGLGAGRPWKVSVAGERAAVRPAAEAREFPPVLLVREAGLWRVDLVEMGKAFRRAPGGTWRRWNLEGPYWLVLGSETAPKVEALAPVELWGEPLADAIARLEASDTPEARVRLAEILLRNAWLPGEVLARWDEALSLAEPDAALARRFADRADYLDLPLLAAATLMPFGDTEATHIAELLLRGGRIDEGTLLLQGALGERARRRKALEDAVEPMPRAAGPSI